MIVLGPILFSPRGIELLGGARPGDALQLRRLTRDECPAAQIFP